MTYKLVSDSYTHMLTKRHDSNNFFTVKEALNIHHDLIAITALQYSASSHIAFWVKYGSLCIQ